MTVSERSTVRTHSSSVPFRPPTLGAFAACAVGVAPTESTNGLMGFAPSERATAAAELTHATSPAKNSAACASPRDAYDSSGAQGQGSEPYQ